MTGATTRTKGRSTKDTQDWLDVQQVLWSLINTAFPAEGRWFDGVDWARHVAEVNDPQHPKRAIPQIARFQASATEQEIWCGALSAANAERHVIACFREIANRGDFTAAEVKDFFDRTDSGEFDEPAAAARQTALEGSDPANGWVKTSPLPIPFSRLKREMAKCSWTLLRQTPRHSVMRCSRDSVRSSNGRSRSIGTRAHKASTERAARELEIEQDEHRTFRS